MTFYQFCYKTFNLEYLESSDSSYIFQSGTYLSILMGVAIMLDYTVVLILAVCYYFCVCLVSYVAIAIASD